MRFGHIMLLFTVAAVSGGCAGKSTDLTGASEPLDSGLVQDGAAGVGGSGGTSGTGGTGGAGGVGGSLQDGGPDSSLPCPAGWADCDLDPANACEARLDNVENCGQCGHVCAAINAVASCQNGDCLVTCKDGFADCNSNPSDGCEANLASLANCGACGTPCGGPNANATCSGGVCQLACIAGYDNCDGNKANGCEAPLDSSQNCGACGVACTGPCIAGSCQDCTDAFAIDDPLAEDAAKAMGACGGLVSAQWVLPDGSLPTSLPNYDLGHGILPDFGPNVAVQTGARLLALSSGTARRPADPGYQAASGFDKGFSCSAPLGFPKESAACPGVVTGEPRDGAALELTLTVPPQATGVGFRFSFYTYEWPAYICSEYNDFFVALMSPIPMGLADGNIAFDAQGNPFSVNNALLEACTCTSGPPCTAGGKPFNCSLGGAMLTGTGFETGAATGWLETTAPVTPGSTITLRFAIYDSGDGILDSTVLLDGFRWLTTPGVTVSTHPI